MQRRPAQARLRLLFDVWRRLEAQDRFAFLHQVETITRHDLEISRIGFEQIDLASLVREQRLLLVHLRLEIVDLSPALSEFFVGRQKQTDDDKQGRERKKDAENTVETLPYGGFTSRAKIAVPRLFH
jgi:hypothetical protein